MFYNTVARCALGLVLFLAVSGCRTYEVSSIRTKKWPDASEEKLRDVGIGFFESAGSAKMPLTQQNFYDSLAFSMREIGYVTLEQSDVGKVLQKSALPPDRLLSDDELVRLTREFGARLFVQGRIQEVKTETLLEDYVQVMITVWIYDAQRGEKIGEIKLFGQDLDYNTGKQTLEMTRLISQDLEKLIVNRDEDTTYRSGK